eukprot:1058460-Lingulodinium_polyedra.AAC.1
MWPSTWPATSRDGPRGGPAQTFYVAFLAAGMLSAASLEEAQRQRLLLADALCEQLDCCAGAAHEAANRCLGCVACAASRTIVSG